MAKESIEQLQNPIDHKNVDADHPLDYPVTSVKSSIKVRGPGGSQKLKCTQAGGGMFLTTLESQGSVKLEALTRGTDPENDAISREIRTGFRIPVESIPDLIDELEEAVADIEENATERGYESVRCDLARGVDDE